MFPIHYVRSPQMDGFISVCGADYGGLTGMAAMVDCPDCLAVIRPGNGETTADDDKRGRLRLVAAESEMADVEALLAYWDAIEAGRLPISSDGVDCPS